MGKVICISALLSVLISCGDTSSSNSSSYSGGRSAAIESCRGVVQDAVYTAMSDGSFSDVQAARIGETALEMCLESKGY